MVFRVYRNQAALAIPLLLIFCGALLIFWMLAGAFLQWHKVQMMFGSSLTNRPEASIAWSC